MTQPDLFAPPVSRAERAFLEYHAEHPEVYEHLVRLARKAVRAGRHHVGIKHLFEIVRWERFVDRADEAGFKCNNNLHSRYARLIMDQERDLDGIFELRELKT